MLDGKTGHAIIQKAKDGGNCILLFGGANQQITREMVDGVMDHFEKGDYLVLQNEISEIGYIMERAREKAWFSYSTLLPWTIKSVPIPWNMWIISC